MEPTFTDGSRLVAQSFSSPGTVPLFVGIYDRSEGVACAFGPAADGSLRCLPKDSRRGGDPGALGCRGADAWPADRPPSAALRGAQRRRRALSGPVVGRAVRRRHRRALCRLPVRFAGRRDGRPLRAPPARASAASSPTPAVASRWRPRLTPARSRCWRWPMTHVSAPRSGRFRDRPDLHQARLDMSGISAVRAAISPGGRAAAERRRGEPDGRRAGR